MTIFNNCINKCTGSLKKCCPDLKKKKLTCKVFEQNEYFLQGSIWEMFKFLLTSLYVNHDLPTMRRSKILFINIYVIKFSFFNKNPGTHITA